MTEALGLVAVGGGPAAFAAVRGYREAGGAGPVALVAEEGRLPYRRPPLTKELLRGELAEHELPLAGAEWLAEHRVELIGVRALAVDPTARTVTLQGGRELSWRRCVLATGAEATRLPVPGAELPGVHVIRSLDHVRGLLARLVDGEPVVVVGAGFIGCEIAASLRHRGHPVRLVATDAAPNAVRLGLEAAEIIAEWLAADGIELRLDAPVSEIAATPDGGFAVHTERGTVHGRQVVIGGGVAPRGELAAQAGLALEHGAVPADATLRTALEGVLVAGDVAFAENAAAGRRLHVEHWGDALAQGEVAGAVAAGGEARWDAVPGFWSAIGPRTLKYAAWGDGYDASRIDRHDGGAFTVWYGREGVLAGVLTHRRDGDYETGRARIAAGEPW